MERQLHPELDGREISPLDVPLAFRNQDLRNFEDQICSLAH